MKTTLLERPEAQYVLFHPRRDDYPIIQPNAHIISIEVEPGVSVGGRIYPADTTSPAILYYHGNGEIAADYDDLYMFYTQIGITLCIVDYRGYGTSSGFPSAQNLVSDAIPVFKTLPIIFQQHGLHPSHIFVMGRSLGSVPSIEIALNAEEKPAGLIVESGFSDTFGLLKRMGVHMSDVDEERDGFGNAFKIARVTIPTLILHGQQDVLIPPSDGTELYHRCGSQDKHLEFIPYAGHNDIMLVGSRQYFKAIHHFVTQHAK